MRHGKTRYSCDADIATVYTACIVVKEWAQLLWTRLDGFSARRGANVSILLYALNKCP